MWVSPPLAEQIGDRDPLTFLDALSSDPGRVRPATDVWCIECGDEPMYVKHFKPVGESGGVLRRLRRMFRRSFALHCMRIAHHMQRRGILTAPVVLAGRRRVGPIREHLLVTRTMPGQSLQALLLGSANCREQVQLVELAAEHISAMHRAGFVHGDLLPGNLVVSPDRNELFFVDNDRTTLRHNLVSRRGRRRNIEQITYRLAAFTRCRVTRAFLRRYCEARGIRGQRARYFRLSMLRYARQRLAASPHERQWQTMVSGH